MIRKTNDEFINELRVINPLVRPLEQYAGSAVNIKCECLNCGHIWSVRPANLLFGKGCPVCNKIKATTKLKATRAAKNNLAEKHPELVLEWDLENNELRPEDYACGSDQEAHWVCSWCGEKWVMQIKKRALRGDGCPRCRKQATSFEEQAIFYYCKKIYKDAKNRDNHLGFEIDVFIPEPNLAIEYDGLRWHKSKDALTRDNKKDLMCKEAGIDLVRFRDQSLPTTEYARIIPCKDSDHSALEESIRELLFSVLKNNEFPIDIEKDTLKILASFEENKRNNSIAARFPELAKEWNYEKNEGLLPEKIPCGYGRKVWWCCPVCGREYQDTPNHRTGRNSGCPDCSIKVVAEKNNVKVVNLDTGVVYDSLKSAAESCNGNKPGICRCCNGEIKTAFGYRWGYFDESKRRRPHRNCKIRCIEKNIVFENDKEAAHWCKGDNRNINAVCNGRAQTYRGYHWEYIEELGKV